LSSLQYDLLLDDVTSTFFEGERGTARWRNADKAATNDRTASKSASRWW
jgi:hypothetical protein